MIPASKTAENSNRMIKSYFFRITRSREFEEEDNAVFNEFVSRHRKGWSVYGRCSIRDRKSHCRKGKTWIAWKRNRNNLAIWNDYGYVINSYNKHLTRTKNVITSTKTRTCHLRFPAIRRMKKKRIVKVRPRLKKKDKKARMPTVVHHLYRPVQVMRPRARVSTAPVRSRVSVAQVRPVNTLRPLSRITSGPDYRKVIRSLIRDLGIASDVIVTSYGIHLRNRNVRVTYLGGVRYSDVFRCVRISGRRDSLPLADHVLAKVLTILYRPQLISTLKEIH